MEESKETGGFVAGDSKGGQSPFWHTTLLAKSSVLYLYEADRIRKSGVARAPRGASATRTAHGNGECPFEARSVSVFFFAKDCSRGERILSKEKVQAM